jgi:hypothetical protein
MSIGLFGGWLLVASAGRPTCLVALWAVAAVTGNCLHKPSCSQVHWKAPVGGGTIQDAPVLHCLLAGMLRGAGAHCWTCVYAASRSVAWLVALLLLCVEEGRIQSEDTMVSAEALMWPCAVHIMLVGRLLVCAWMSVSLYGYSRSGTVALGLYCNCTATAGMWEVVVGYGSQDCMLYCAGMLDAARPVG